jgi:hypothetical protein
MPTVAPGIRRIAFAIAVATAAVVVACTENLPMGPNAFSATVSVTSLPDTIVVGDTKTVSAIAKDAAGNQVSGLTYTWAVGDTGVLGLGASDSASGRTRTVSAKRPGVSSVTLHLPDARFVTSNASKNVTAVIALLQITTSRDTTMTAIGDTLMVRASGYVKSGATTVVRPLSGLTWQVRSSGSTAILATGDSARVIAVGNGVDTIIVGHPYCLAGARCADTAFVRVTQSLRIALAKNTLSAWSFGDTVSSAATVKDRRGLGQSGTYLKFFPKAAADSAAVTVTPLFGLNQSANGSMAVSRFIAKANGTAKVVVQAYNAADALIDTASVTVTVRQLAVRSTVFPLVSSVTHGDSVPLRARAIDARGNVIADATVALTPVSGTLSGVFWAIGAAPSTAATQMVWADVAGAAVAANNTGAPAVTMARDTAVVQSLPPITVVAGADSATKVLTPKVLTYAAVPVADTWVRHIYSGGVTTVDSTKTSVDGTAQVTWTVPTTVGTYRFTSLQRQGTTVPATAADSAGLILARRTVRVIAAAANAATTRVTPADTVPAAGATMQLSVIAKDVFGNLTTTIAPADITTTVKLGTVGAWGCTGNACTATYTAPATIVSDTVSVKISGSHLLGSPFQVRTTPGAPSAAKSVFSAPSPVTHSTTATITLTVKDANNNVVTTATPSDFVASTSAGAAIGTWTCTSGVCTALWLAPPGIGTTATITVTIGGTNVIGSVATITVP